MSIDLSKFAWVKLDLGCGTKKQEGAIGVDSLSFNGAVDVVHDLTQAPWPFPDSSVDEAHSSHFLEHLTGAQRVTFFNELYRVLKPAAKATIIGPDWSNACAYGDPTHAWPPLSPWLGLYTNKDWRKGNAPHVDSELAPDAPFSFSCDFDWMNVYSMEEWLMLKHQEYRQDALAHKINSARDIIFTFQSKKPIPAPEPAPEAPKEEPVPA